MYVSLYSNHVHECCVLQSPKNMDDQIQALLCIRAEIRMATSSMTSVPKPLKLLREHFDELDSCYNDLVTDSPSKKLLADVLSVLAMAVDDKAERKCLNYRLQGSQEKVSSFGHPYIRYVCTYMDVMTITNSHVMYV